MLSLDAGQVIAGRYRLEREIGRGGMGVVFAALDVVKGTKVAVKVLLEDDVFDVTRFRRFEREALAMRALSHPNVVQLLDFRAERGEVICLVMELLHGETARQRMLRVGRLEIADVVRLLVQLLSALEAVHAASLVHRDVKPSNVFLSQGGPAVLLDLGVAKRLAGDQSVLTREGDVVGTIGYIAPEVFLDQRATAKSDVYAVGVTAFELLTGRRPFDGAAPQLRALVGKDKAPDVRSLRPEVPAALAELINEMLSHDVRARPDCGTITRRLGVWQHERDAATVVDAPTAGNTVPLAKPQGQSAPDTQASPINGWALTEPLSPRGGPATPSRNDVDALGKVQAPPRTYRVWVAAFVGGVAALALLAAAYWFLASRGLV